MAVAIKVENLSKAYQLGEIGTGTLSRDIERWFAKVRGKEDPFLKIGETNDRTSKGTSDIVWSLKDINFEIEQGDAVGIIGRNGAGKSTLLKLLSRVTSPTTGSIKVKGRIASLLEVGTGFHPELTGRENIYLNGAILGMRKKEITRKFDEIVEFAGVERYIDTPVKRYSSGMYVRLAFAVAAHLESEILIVDEVLAVGDAEFQKKCLGKMGEVSKGEGRTVLFVSHNMGSIKKLCNKGILYDKGLLIYKGQVHETVEKYVQIARNYLDNDGMTGIIEWKENEMGKDECYLLSVGIFQNSTVSQLIDSDKEFNIDIVYKVVSYISDFSISFNIVNDAEEIVLHSADIFAITPNYQPSRNEGIYISRCKIPTRFFNEGSFSLNVVGDIPNVKAFFHLNSILKFRVENTSAKASKYSSSMWKGSLSPEVVNWELYRV